MVNSRRISLSVAVLSAQLGVLHDLSVRCFWPRIQVNRRLKNRQQIVHHLFLYQIDNHGTKRRINYKSSETSRRPSFFTIRRTLERLKAFWEKSSYFIQLWILCQQWLSSRTYENRVPYYPLYFEDIDCQRTLQGIEFGWSVNGHGPLGNGTRISRWTNNGQTRVSFEIQKCYGFSLYWEMSNFNAFSNVKKGTSFEN